MYSASEIRIVHLETTSKCNATCPMCLRSVQGGRINPHLPITELSLEQVKQIFSESFLHQINKLYMCGNYGDPAAAKDTLEIFRWLRSVNPRLELEIFSNGGLRTPKWWEELASLVNKAVFAVDGLADTNHLYRKGVQWSKVEENMKAFLGAGGNARWDYIVFYHNEHQVEEARALAETWGVQKFQVKKTGRFFSNPKSSGKEQQEVWDKSDRVEYHIEKPTIKKYLNSSFEIEPKIEAEFGSLRNYFESSEVTCKVVKEKSVYVTAQGYALPCCWLGSRMYPWYNNEKSSEVWPLFNALEGGENSLNAIERGLENVINGQFFQRTLPESWGKTSFKEGKLFTCSKTCGRKDFDLFKSQFES